VRPATHFATAFGPRKPEPTFHAGAKVVMIVHKGARDDYAYAVRKYVVEAGRTLGSSGEQTGGGCLTVSKNNLPCMEVRCSRRSCNDSGKAGAGSLAHASYPRLDEKSELVNLRRGRMSRMIDAVKLAQLAHGRCER